MSVNSPKGLCTPVRRLGLSRKVLSPKVTDASSPVLTPKSKAVKRTFAHFKLANNMCEETTSDSPKLQVENTSPESEDGTELNNLKRKLASLENVDELEKDLDLWREGCKEALLELQSCLQETDDLKLTCTDLAKKLGIWEVIVNNFHDDEDIMTQEDCNSE